MSLAIHAVGPAAYSAYFPPAITTRLADHGIGQTHLELLYADDHVMHALQHFNQIRRDVSANVSSGLVQRVERINLAQQMLISHIHEAWKAHPEQRDALQDMQLQLALIDGLICSLP